jgi:hypothetical protein
VATGIATVLMPPARIPTGVRRSVHVSLVLAAAGATVWVLGHTEPSGPGQQADLPLPTLPNSIPLHTRLVLSTLLGSLAAASSAVGMRLDTAAEQALRRRGVRRPRLWIGVAAAAVTATISWADARDQGGRRRSADRRA